MLAKDAKKQADRNNTLTGKALVAIRAAVALGNHVCTVDSDMDLDLGATQAELEEMGYKVVRMPHTVVRRWIYSISWE